MDPVVDQDMETSVRGVFACGNVVAISDLVDDVTKQAELAGERAVELLPKSPKQTRCTFKNGKRRAQPLPLKSWCGLSLWKW